MFKRTRIIETTESKISSVVSHLKGEIENLQGEGTGILAEFHRVHQELDRVTGALKVKQETIGNHIEDLKALQLCIATEVVANEVASSNIKQILGIK